MTTRLLCLATAALALCAAPCHAQQPSEHVAVMELAGNGVSVTDLAGLSNRLRMELFNTGRFTVIERSRMEDILKEQGFQRTGCTNTECAVEIGQLIGVRKIVVGSIDKVAETYSVNIRMVDVVTGRIHADVASDCDACGLADVLKTTIRNAARRLAGLEAPAVTTASGPAPAAAVAPTPAAAAGPPPKIVMGFGSYQKDGVGLSGKGVMNTILKDPLACPEARTAAGKYLRRQRTARVLGFVGGALFVGCLANGLAKGSIGVTVIGACVGIGLILPGGITGTTNRGARIEKAAKLYNECTLTTGAAAPAADPATPAPVKKRQGYRGR